MALTTRRQFLLQAAFAGAALSRGSMRAIARARRTLEAMEQNAAPTDAAAIRKLVSRISGHVITPETPDYESARLVFQPRIRSASGADRSLCRRARRRAGGGIRCEPESAAGRLKPRENTVRVKSYLEAQAAAFLPAPVAHFQTDLFLPELEAAAIAKITTATHDAPSNTRVFIVPLYGATSRVGVSDMAFPLCQPGYELDLVGTWIAPAEKASSLEWVKSLRDNLQPFRDGV